MQSGAAEARRPWTPAFVSSAAVASSTISAAPGQATAWAGLRLHQIRYVLAAAECGGFRRAARRLGVQQSAVSRRIQELEDRLGARIFERGPSGVLLTPVGRDFVEGAHGAMVELDRAVDQVADLARGEQDTLRIGILAPLGPGPLDDLLRRLLAAVPDLTLEIAEGDAREHFDALARGRLDVAFLPGQVSGQRFDVHRAWREHLLAALPADDALAAQHSVRWKEIVERRLLLPAEGRRDLEALIARRVRRLGGEARMAPQLAGHATVLRLAALGQGVALVPESCAPRVNGVVYRPIHREILAYNAVIGRRPQKPVARRLLGLIGGA